MGFLLNQKELKEIPFRTGAASMQLDYSLPRALSTLIELYCPGTAKYGKTEVCALESFRLRDKA